MAPIELIALHPTLEVFMIVFDRPTARRRKGRTSNEMAVAEGFSAVRTDELPAASPDDLSDAGMSTAEYAVGTIAACALATAG